MMVFDCGIDPGYFLDEMELFEVKSLIKRYNLNYQDKWERSRFVAFWTVKSGGSTATTPQDLISFNWEDQPVKMKAKRMSREESLKMMQEKTKSLENFNSGNTEKLNL